MMVLTFFQVPGAFAICRDTSANRESRFREVSGLIAMVNDGREVTLVQSLASVLPTLEADPDWAMFRVEADFGLDVPGVLLSAIKPISEANIGVFALSTFSSDLIFVRQNQVEAVSVLLRNAGHQVNPQAWPVGHNS